MSEQSPDYRLDRRQVRRHFDAVADTYDAAAVLQHEVGERLVERLELMDVTPEVVLDAGCGTGRMTEALVRHFGRKTPVIGMDLAPAMLRRTRQRKPWRARMPLVCGDAYRVPLAEASVEMCLSNLMLQWCDDLEAALRSLRRVLKPRGLLLFSTLGPDTLRELRSAWAAVDGEAHVNRFLDMHDIGDALVRAGFAEPVMDVEHITLTYAEVADLMRDLKAIGARNAAVSRRRGLTGPRRLARLRDAYEPFRMPDGRLPATYEVVYGTAWLPDSTPGVAMGQGGVSLESLRSSLKHKGGKA